MNERLQVLLDRVIQSAHEWSDAKAALEMVEAPNAGGAMAGNEWALSWASVSAVASVSAIVVTLATTFLLRFMDRAEADWVVFEALAEWHDNRKFTNEHDSPLVRAQLANVGDATAYRVRIVGTGCHASFREDMTVAKVRTTKKLELVPKLSPGDQVEIRVRCDPEVWDRAFVTITWIAAPTRRRWSSRRTYTLLLNAVSDPPRFLGAYKVYPDSDGLEERREEDPPSDWAMPELHAPQRVLPSGPGWWVRRVEARRLRKIAR